MLLQRERGQQAVPLLHGCHSIATRLAAQCGRFGSYRIEHSYLGCLPSVMPILGIEHSAHRDVQKTITWQTLIRSCELYFGIVSILTRYAIEKFNETIDMINGHIEAKTTERSLRAGGCNNFFILSGPARRGASQ